MRWWIVGVCVVSACTTPGGNGRVVYRDQATGFSVRFSESRADTSTQMGEVGEIHPAVLEYVLAAPEGPLATYYDLVLRLPSPPQRAVKDLSALASEATRLASGVTPVGHHYARALARKLAPAINRALAWVPEGRGFAFTYVGNAGVWWGEPADLDRNVLQREYERDFGGVTLRTVIYRHATAGLVELRSSGTGRVYVWDVGNIQGAFDPKHQIDYDSVAERVVRLHPFTQPPWSAP